VALSDVFRFLWRQKLCLESLEIGLATKMAVAHNVKSGSVLSLIRFLELIRDGHFVLERRKFYRPLKGGEQPRKKPTGTQIPVLLRGERYLPDVDGGIALMEGKCIKLSIARDILRESYSAHRMRDELMKPLASAGGVDRKLWKKCEYRPTEEMSQILVKDAELMKACNHLVTVLNDVMEQYSIELDRVSAELERTGRLPRQKYPSIDFDHDWMKFLLQEMSVSREQLEWLLYGSVSMYHYANDFRVEPNQRVKSAKRRKPASAGVVPESDWLDSVVDPIPYD